MEAGHEERDRMADERDGLADAREHAADVRDRLADARDEAATAHGDDLERFPGGPDDRSTEIRQALEVNAQQRRAQRERAARSPDGTVAVDGTDWGRDRRDFIADDRQEQADRRDALADERDALADALEAYQSTTAHGGPGAHSSGLPGQRTDRVAAAQLRVNAAVARQAADLDRDQRVSPRPLAAEFVKIGQALLTGDRPERGMEEVVLAAVRFVNGCDAASFSVLVNEVVTTIAASHPVADELDQVQYRTSQGPCLEAIATLQAVISDDLSRDERWPAFVAEASRSASSAMATPVLDDRPMRSTFGSLNAYGTRAAAFDQEDADVAMLLTAHLAILLRLVATAQESTVRAAQLSEAVVTRDVIGQAKGILMARDRITAGEAFDVLRAASMRLNRKLRDVADDLTKGHAVSMK
jgi:hypothetical protein